MEILKLYFGKTLYYKRLYFGISQEAMAEKCKEIAVIQKFN